MRRHILRLIEGLYELLIIGALLIAVAIASYGVVVLFTSGTGLFVGGIVVVLLIVAYIIGWAKE